jgi:hypothetical protein
MRAITVSVGYHDFLDITLRAAIPHFESIMVVTDYEDVETMEVIEEHGVKYHQTNAFYRDSCKFNKGAALEEGFDSMGREGWMVVMDADIVMPETVEAPKVEAGNLYCPRRRECRQPHENYLGQKDWSHFPVVGDLEHAGFFQLFHASDPVLAVRPWYGVQWKHAGGCDSDFQAKWPNNRKLWLPFDVLHLGEHGTNWCGRVTRMMNGDMPEAAEGNRMQMARMMARRRAGHGYADEWIQEDEDEEMA